MPRISKRTLRFLLILAAALAVGVLGAAVASFVGYCPGCG